MGKKERIDDPGFSVPLHERGVLFSPLMELSFLPQFLILLTDPNPYKDLLLNLEVSQDAPSPLDWRRAGPGAPAGLCASPTDSGSAVDLLVPTVKLGMTPTLQFLA